MTMSFRHHVAVVLIGMAITGSLLAPGLAGAGTTTVTFRGAPLLDLSTLACPSTPSQPTLTVAAGETVDFINQTGKTATLRAGDGEKIMPNKSLVPVTFTRGPAAIVVQMLPKCSLDLGKHTQMMVRVAATLGSSSASPTDRSAALASSAAGGTAAASPAIFGAATGPALPRSASGLLALIAAVGAIGVAAAGIRALAAQRANRSLTT
jgi:hypothetical protein